MAWFGARIRGVTNTDLMKCVQDIVALSQLAQDKLDKNRSKQRIEYGIKKRGDMIKLYKTNNSAWKKFGHENTLFCYSTFEDFCENAIARINHLREDARAGNLEEQKKLQ